MPRANRYILAGQIYHVTHRCHDRQWLLKFAIHRTEYRRRLRLALKEYDLSLLAYALTSNHTHLLIHSRTTEALSGLMQQLEGEFAESYNRRKQRSGAFWNGRYHATMIDSDDHLWNCMTYIDLNMVRAGVVSHPRDWAWCGYDELAGLRQRYRLLNIDKVLELVGAGDAGDFARHYQAAIAKDLQRGRLAREPVWTESIAVGSQAFVARVAGAIHTRAKLEQFENPDGHWVLREPPASYEVKATGSGIEENALAPKIDSENRV